MKTMLRPACVVAALAISATSSRAQVGPWPMFRCNPAHHGASAFGGARTGALEWSYDTGGMVTSSPSIDAQGRIHVGSWSNLLFVLSRPGALVWSYATSSPIDYSSPAVSNDGRIFVGSTDYRAYSLTSAGSLSWSYDTNGSIETSPALRAGTVVLTGGDRLFALGMNASFQWSYRTYYYGYPLHSSPAVASDGRVCVGAEDYCVYAFESAGTLLWSYDTELEVLSSPALGTDGRIYVGSYSDNSMLCFTWSGAIAWSYVMENGIYRCSPALGADGGIYIGALDNVFYSLTTAGTVAWSYREGGAYYSSPALGSDGMVYVGSYDNRVYAFGSNGALAWSHVTGDCVWSSPAIGSDGAVFVGSNDNRLYAFADRPTATPTVTPVATVTPAPTATVTPPVDLTANKTEFGTTDSISVTADVWPLTVPCYPFVRIVMADGSTLWYQTGVGFSASPVPYLGFGAGPITLASPISDYPALSADFSGIAAGTYVLEGGAVDATQTTSADNLVYWGRVDQETLEVR